MSIPLLFFTSFFLVKKEIAATSIKKATEAEAAPRITAKWRRSENNQYKIESVQWRTNI